MAKRPLAGLTLIGFVSAQVLSVGVVRAETVNMGYDAAHPIHAPKVVSGVNFQYDRNGNLENDGERILSWNADNLSVKILKDGIEVSLFYDADGGRVVKQQDRTNRTVYVNQYLEVTQLPNNTITQNYYFVGGRRLAQSTINNQQSAVSYYHHDYLGSTVLATNQDSQPLSQVLTYFPYGNLTSESMSQRVSESMKYLYTGQELDDGSDLYNYQARLYNPATGVFVSADTAGGSFAYASGNPLRFTDPTGYWAIEGAGYVAPPQDPDTQLQITISSGGYQPPTIGATGVINDANVVYTPQDISPAGQALLLGMVGFSFGVAGLAQAAPAVIGACGLGPAWCAGAVGGVAAELAAPPQAQLGPTTAMRVGATQALTGKAATKVIARRLNQAAELSKQGRNEEAVRLLADEEFARSVGIRLDLFGATDVHPDYIARESWYHFEARRITAPREMWSVGAGGRPQRTYPTKTVELLMEEWHHAAMDLGGGNQFTVEQTVAQWFKARNIPHTPEFARRYPERAILGPR